MAYLVNFGSHAFSVPSAVVDHFLKLASEAQLKVLLYLLRCPEQQCSPAQAAAFLHITEEQAEDAMQFWSQANILIHQESAVQTQFSFMSAPSEPSASSEATQSVPAPATAITSIQRNSKEIKLDPSEIAQMLESSQDLKDLFICAEKLFGRILNHMEQRSLLWMHSYLGIRSEVLLILLGYCISIDKASMSYAEAIAINWTEQDILTLESAEAEVQRLKNEHTFTTRIQKMFEMHRRPTTQQKQYMDAWQTAGYSMELLQYAYELTIENTEKLNFKYLNAILENWQKQGITTVEQAKALSNSTAVKKKSTGKGNEKLTSQEIDEMNDYLSVVNRFRKE